MREIQILKISEFVEQHRRNWKEHTDCTKSDRITKKKKILKYHSKVKINLG
jgi:hypothetical protein